MEKVVGSKAKSKGLGSGSPASRNAEGQAEGAHGAVGVSRAAALGSVGGPARPAPRPARPLSAPGAALAAEGDIW